MSTTENPSLQEQAQQRTQRLMDQADSSFLDNFRTGDSCAIGFLQSRINSLKERDTHNIKFCLEEAGRLEEAAKEYRVRAAEHEASHAEALQEIVEIEAAIATLKANS